MKEFGTQKHIPPKKKPPLRRLGFKKMSD